MTLYLIALWEWLKRQATSSSKATYVGGVLVFWLGGTIQIATVAKGVIDLIQIGQEIYEATANAMDAAEQEKESGADKKAWVLAYIKSIVLELGENWDN